MVNLGYFCINCFVICCIFGIFWAAEAKKISQEAGSTVTLNCSNNSFNTFSDLRMGTWEMNGKIMFSFRPKVIKTSSNESVTLNLKMSESESLPYALIIEDVQKAHEGNYTCTTTVNSGVNKEDWELIITEGKQSVDELKIAVIAAVPSACFLILASVLVILTFWKRRAKNRSPTEIRQQKQVEDIYENHLEIQRRQAYLHQP